MGTLFKMIKENQIKIIIDAKKIALSFFLVVFILTLINSLVLIFYFTFDDPSVYGLVKWFDFDLEYNIPSFYSSLSILFCSFLLFIISVSKKNTDTHNAYWFLLSAIFAFLSLDEAFKIHEHIGGFTEYFVKPEGFLYFPWVVPYGIGLVLFVTIYLRFLSSLPRKFMFGFIFSGTIYIFGAIGFEIFGAREAGLNGLDSVKYCILYTCEEFLEMSGIILFMYVLFCYIETKIEYVSIFGIKKFFIVPKNNNTEYL